MVAMTLRVLIADDEDLAREALRGFLEGEAGVAVVGECATGRETLEAIRAKSPDVVFLDVRMPELGGFEVVEAMGKDRMPVVVFVTAHDQFAVRAFEARAVDYLLKPFDRDRFRDALGRARQAVERRAPAGSAEELYSLVASLKGARKGLEQLTVRTGGRLVFIRIDEVDWIASADNYCELHVAGAVHLLRRTLAGLEADLPEKFIRISRSAVVNADRIKEIQPKSHGDYLVVLRNGKQLPASRNHRAGLMRILGKE